MTMLRCRAVAVAVAAAVAPAVALSAALSACDPLAADYTASEWPKTLKLDPAPAQLAVGFAPGSGRLLSADSARLQAIAASGGFSPPDRVVVAIGGPPTLASARFDSVAAALLPYGVVPSPALVTGAAPDAAVIRRERYVVMLPRCPDWSKPAAGAGDFTNSVSSNFGCATSLNLGLTVAQPADLVTPRQLGFSDARPAADAVNNYRLGKVQLPAAAKIGPIAATAIQAPAAPGAAEGVDAGGGAGAAP